MPQRWPQSKRSLQVQLHLHRAVIIFLETRVLLRFLAPAVQLFVPSAGLSHLLAAPLPLQRTHISRSSKTFSCLCVPLWPLPLCHFFLSEAGMDSLSLLPPLCSITTLPQSGTSRLHSSTETTLAKFPDDFILAKV